MKTKKLQRNVPTSWQQLKLADVVVFLDSKRVPIEFDTRSRRKGIYPYYGASGIIDYIDSYIFDGEFILLGEDGANILDRSSRLAFIVKGKIWVNNHAHVLKVKENTKLYFLSEYLESLDYTKFNTGSAQPKLNRSVCEKIPVLLPPLPEQDRIVAVLEAWDKAIEKLSKKIEIKKQIKKRLMQELLTGKTRLSGFNEKWSEIAVGKAFSFLRTYAISRENLINGTTNESGVGNIHYGDIHSTYGTSSIDLKNVSVPLVKDNNFSPRAEDFLRDGDLIMADVSEDYEGIGVTVLVHGLESKRVVGGLHTFVLRDTNKKTVERYRQYIFRNPNLRNELKKIANGVSVYGISKINLSRLILILPPLSEQSRIVGVLESQDKTIENLSKKLSLLKDQKKYLLNNLITGVIRAPETLKVKV